MNCYCLINDDNFNVISCNDAAGRPELKFTVDRDFFNQNLNWQADQVGFLKFITDYSVEQPSQKTNESLLKQLTITKRLFQKMNYKNDWMTTVS